MALIDANGRVLGTVNIIDACIGLIITLLVVGILLVQSGWYQTSGKVIEGESDILIHVQLSDLKTLDKELFKAGEKTSITIRNQPRGEVTIVNGECRPLQITLMDNHQPISTPDAAEPNGYECFVTLKDHSLVTADGYVSEGVKVKIGLGIELEGFKYRTYGRITDVVAVE